ncbi:hypothetical protein IW261DRAFT_1574050 [Armillaria novae-zelandiae]|uniref:F-box domain-containing protein n=1 Tax=Armillaria novae-zelandiae TaxID=153914 RepID=A0AA39TVC0_9AGAR|nr:hypothetical protein IW261DRAFT_1574050 [Armillaria novae-zelandiae]
MLQRFRVCSYDPTEIHSIFSNTQHLIEIAITMCLPPRHLNIVPPWPITYSPVVHTSLRQLSFVLTWEKNPRITKIPQTMNYITLPALNKLRLLTTQKQPSPEIFPTTMHSIEYSRIVNLLHRSRCHLTDLTISIPVPVDSFLNPVLRQCPALEKLDIFVHASTASGVFRVLNLTKGKVPNLKKLRVADAPYRGGGSALLLQGDAFLEMVQSRFGANSHLETLQLSLTLKMTWLQHKKLIPIARDSPLRDLVKMKEEGLNVELLFNLRDCLVEGEASTAFFGSS